jgi:hypothetical protein
VFVGIQLTTAATSPLQRNVLLLQVIEAFGAHPSWGS